MSERIVSPARRALRFRIALLVAIGCLAAPSAGIAQLVTMDTELPRTMVFLDEEGAAAATTLTSFLSEAGFPVIDPSFAKTATERERARKALAGDEVAATALGRDLGAQVLILGSISADAAASAAHENLQTGTADLSVRALRLDDPRVVSTGSVQSRILEATPGGARSAATRKAMEELLYSTAFLGDVLTDWQERAWEDEAYWELGPQSIPAQLGLGDPGPEAAAPGPDSAAVDEPEEAEEEEATEEPAGAPSTGPVRIAVLESDAYPDTTLGAGRAIVVAPRLRARIRGLVSRTDATVEVAGRSAEMTPLSPEEAERYGLTGGGLAFEAEVPLEGEDVPVPVHAWTKEGETRIDVVPGIGRTWAVVIGISDYADPGITPLEYADDDARSIHDFLRSPRGGEVPESRIRMLLNEEATAEAVREALFVFLQQARPEDLVMVYIAAHGSPDPNRPKNLYLLTHDTDADAMASTAFPMWDVKTALRRQIAAERVVVFADACRSAGTLSGEANPVGGAFTQLFSPSRRMTLSAADLNEVSYEDERWGGGHGVFTHFLMKALDGEGDTDRDGVVTFAEAAAYVRAEVPRATDGRQNPQRAGLGDMPIAPPEVKKSK